MAAMAYSGAFRMRDDPPRDSAPAPARRDSRPPRPQETIDRAVGGLLKKLESVNMETDDLILALILYLMYRESGDKDLLIMLGAMLLT